MIVVVSRMVDEVQVMAIRKYEFLIRNRWVKDEEICLVLHLRSRREACEFAHDYTSQHTRMGGYDVSYGLYVDLISEYLEDGRIAASVSIGDWHDARDVTDEDWDEEDWDAED